MLLTSLLLGSAVALADDPSPPASPPAEATTPAEEAPPPAEAEAPADSSLEVTHEAMKVKRRVQPAFPPGRFDRGASFECTIDVHVSADGRPTAVEAQQAATCPEPFARASEDAIRQWTWRPYKVDGTPVSVRFTTQTIFVK